MNLQSINAFCATQISLPENVSPKIKLQYFQTTQTLELTGAILEAQFAFGNMFILFVTEDCPFEETLHIYLLDAHLRLIDSIRLAAWHTPAILSDLSISLPNQIEFSFFSNKELWCLDIFEKPVFLWKLNRYPVKRTQFFWVKSCMNLTRHTQKHPTFEAQFLPQRFFERPTT